MYVTEKNLYLTINKPKPQRIFYTNE